VTQVEQIGLVHIVSEVLIHTFWRRGRKERMERNFILVCMYCEGKMVSFFAASFSSNLVAGVQFLLP